MNKRNRVFLKLYKKGWYSFKSLNDLLNEFIRVRRNTRCILNDLSTIEKPNFNEVYGIRGV